MDRARKFFPLKNETLTAYYMHLWLPHREQRIITSYKFIDDGPLEDHMTLPEVQDFKTKGKPRLSGWVIAIELYKEDICVYSRKILLLAKDESDKDC